jgi:hypothetical protein
MANTQVDLFRRWFFENKRTNNVSSIEVSDDLMSVVHKWYDYTVAVKRPDDPFVLLNTDTLRYNGTGCLFSSARHILKGNAIPIPFAATHKANIDLNDVELIYKDRAANSYYSMEGVVFKANNRIMITCKDEYWHGIVELDVLPHSWDHGMDILTPHAIRRYQNFCAQNQQIYWTIRQGEWWFIPRPHLSFRKTNIENYRVLGSSNHTATYCVQSCDAKYVRGTIRHHPDAKYRGSWYKRYYRPMLRLGNCWHEVHKSNQVASFRG